MRDTVKPVSLVIHPIFPVSVQNTKKVVANQGYTYNQAGMSYNEAGVEYGGLYGYDEINPIIIEIVPIHPSITFFPTSRVTIIDQTDKAIYDQGYTYNQAGMSYNESGVGYGGLYGHDKIAVPVQILFNNFTGFKHIKFHMKGQSMGLLLDLTYLD